MRPARRWHPRAAAIVAAALLTAACSSGGDSTPLPSGADPPAECARADASGVIVVTARNLAYSAPCMVVTAGSAFTIRFTNEEAIPHDVAVYEDDSTNNEIMRGEIITGPDRTIDYSVSALDAGTYFFHCTVHNAMKGALYVVAP